MIELSPDPFDPAAELDAFRRHAGEGAILSFTGVVRGGEVMALELDHYPGFTERQLRTMVEELVGKYQLSAARVRHRVGRINPGEPIMFAATAALHRRAAFNALDELMDRLKIEAPIWKQEIRADGDRWVEPRQSDHDDQARWSVNAPQR